MIVRHRFAQTRPPGRALMVRVATFAVYLVLSLIAGISHTGRVTTAQTIPPTIYWERSVEMDHGALAAPAGLAYSPQADVFYVVERGAAARAHAVTTISVVTAYGERLESLTLAIPPAPSLHLTYDSRWQRLLLWDGGRRDLISVAARADGSLDSATLTHFDAAHWGARRVTGMAFDTDRDHLYLLDGVGPRLLRIVPADDGNWAGATVTPLAIAAPLVQPQGLAYDPVRDHLHVATLETLYELTLNGDIVAGRDLAAFALDKVGGLAFAPSADRTDDLQQVHLYFAGHTRTKQADQEGQFMEFSLAEADQPRAQAAAPNSVQIIDLVQTIDSSQWSPPSPDPSGIIHLPDLNLLAIADSEVNETITITRSGQIINLTLYAGVNVWQITPGGDIVSTWNTEAFSDEPTSLTVNPANQHLFVGDDTGIRGVFELNPGADGVYGSGDDTTTFFDTSHFDSMDPEGLAYAADLGLLFIIDGVNREVYSLSPGPNGIFDGVAPTGDDTVTHFDTLSFGLDDPEGIAYSPANGHLYGVGRPADTLFEFTTAGALVQAIDIAHLRARGLGDLAIAPSSHNPSGTSIYIVARGIDNEFVSDGIPNDGKIYELSLTAPVTENTPISLYLPLMTQ